MHPLNVIGEPDIPCSFKKAITEPENVIAPTAALLTFQLNYQVLYFLVFQD